MSKESIAFLIMIVSFITGLVCMSLLIAYGLAPSKTDLILWRIWVVLVLIEIPFIISLFYVMKRSPDIEKHIRENTHVKVNKETGKVDIETIVFKPKEK